MKYLAFWFLLVSSICCSEPILLLLGPPGSGKGTFSQYFKMKYNFKHCSVGDLVRLEIDQATDFGKKAAEMLKQGDFLEESMIQALIAEQIVQLCQNPCRFILDGFPRTEESARFLYKLFCELGIQNQVIAVLLESNDLVCQERILDRIVCKQCGFVYNTNHALPEISGTCNQCKAPLAQRPFDDLLTAQRRLEKYHLVMGNTIDFCMKQYRFVHFSTEYSIDKCYLQYDLFLETLVDHSQ